ncbi:2'-deoxymugineic-acid 2'-dioxygenase-like [Silene latifolia]|uniref:2'-deoxymugineic-acid 2'-dioxygenase-like n=1 Tax=Silene latifolia TaxID=37657 RepID=UPI003D76A8BA
MLTDYLRQINGGVFPADHVILPDERIENNLFVPPPFHLSAADLVAINSPAHHDRISQKLVEMAQRYGMFYITNHGIRDRVMTNALWAAKMFFELPSYEFKRECERCLFYSSSVVHHLNLETEAKYWRDTLPFYLSSMPLWPENPPRFRDDISQFASALEVLANKLIRLISRGLKLDESYFHDHGLSQVRRLNVNRYPRCPNPKLTCGLAKHCDPDLLTITFVEAGDAAQGLEVCIDNEWKRVVPRDDALIVTIGSQMRVVSNKKLKAPVHRVVVNSRSDRTSICYAVAPSNDSYVEPAEVLTRTESPRYEKYKYGDYLLNHLGHYRDTTGVLPSYEKRN